MTAAVEAAVERANQSIDEYDKGHMWAISPNVVRTILAALSRPEAGAGVALDREQVARIIAGQEAWAKQEKSSLAKVFVDDAYLKTDAILAALSRPEAGAGGALDRPSLMTAIEDADREYCNLNGEPCCSEEDSLWCGHIADAILALRPVSAVPGVGLSPEPVAWRVRRLTDDPEEWQLRPAGASLDFGNPSRWEIQPLFTSVSPSPTDGNDGAVR